MIKRIGMFMMVVLVLSFSMYIPKEAGASGNLISGTYGGKDYKLYVPSNYDGTEDYPLMMMLHGCSQDADQFIASTKMNALSEEEGILVLYPEQNTAANFNKCWNWFEPGHQIRNSGELNVLVGMVNKLKTDYMVNDDQVFVSGLSAGGAMSVLLVSAYPDVFSGVAVAAGLEYRAATSTMEAVLAMTNGGPDPALQGRAAYEAMGSYAKPIPVIVFHGSSDYTVRPINGEQVTTQWTVTNSLAASGTEDGWMDDIPDSVEDFQVPNGKNYTVYDYHNDQDNPWVRKVIVDGMGHAWSGGSTDGTHVDSTGPDATTMIWDFFQSHVGDNPETLRTIANPGGGTYDESVSVALTTNKEAITYYTIDGTNPTENSPVYTNPITITEDTTLIFFSVDEEGNKEEIQQEEYMIRNEPIGEGTILTSIAEEDGYVGRYVIDGLDSGAVKVGDKGMYNTDTYRGIVSFDTSQITEAIESATLRLYPNLIQGNVNSIQVDMYAGVFGNHATLEQLDYSYQASVSNIAAFSIENDSVVEIEIPTAMLTHINKNGKIQFRLKALTTAGFSSNYAEFYGGENEEFTPQLLINN